VARRRWRAREIGSLSDPAPRSLPGEPSRVFGARVGQTYPAADWPVEDLIVDCEHLTSDGDWAFCRFYSEEIPAVRMGFQAGSFEIGAVDSTPDPERLQLHLEVMTAEGAYLWVPTARFGAGSVTSATDTKDVRLSHHGRELLRISGWPTMEWHVRSDDDELEVRLEVRARTVTVLPDCLLPHVVFGMWETMARARGEVRVGSRVHPVEGHVFYDHPRVLRERHDVLPRQRYLYTTLALADGSGLFGYHAEDVSGSPIGYYCFGVHLDPDGRGSFLPGARTRGLELDEDGIPRRWRFAWEGGEVTAEADVTVRPIPMARGWGGPSAPTSRAGYVIFPLVLDATVDVRQPTGERKLTARGLAEYYDADAWQT
jgi:hypothetical protein